jgi:hypothetical protein
MLINNLLLLKVVSDRGSLLSLHKRGLTSSQIALLLEEQIKCGNIQSLPEGLSLTDVGENLLREGLKKLKLSGPNAWILPQEHLYIEPIDPETVIIP